MYRATLSNQIYVLLTSLKRVLLPVLADVCLHFEADHDGVDGRGVDEEHVECITRTVMGTMALANLEATQHPINTIPISM